MNPLFNLDSVNTAPNINQTARIIRRWVYKEDIFDKPGATLPAGDGSYLLKTITQAGINVEGLSILECGPLEGTHTRRLARAGARIKAIEAKPYNYIKCLISRELEPHDGRFLLGDCVSYLQTTADYYDMIVASGVLYHLNEPLKFLELACKYNYLWLGSCYFLEDVYFTLGDTPQHGLFLNGEVTDFVIGDRTITAKQHQYCVTGQTPAGIGNANGDVGYLFELEDIHWMINYFGHEVIWTNNPDYNAGVICNILSRRKQ